MSEERGHQNPPHRRLGGPQSSCEKQKKSPATASSSTLA